MINVEEVGGTWQVAYVKLRLSGDLQGTVYLTGDMGYDTNTDTFSLSNLKLTPVEVSGFTADVVTTLQDPAFLQTVAEKLKWPFGAKLEAFKTDFNSKLSHKVLDGGFVLDGSMKTLQPVFLTAYPKDCPPIFSPETCALPGGHSAFFGIIRATGTMSVSH